MINVKELVSPIIQMETRQRRNRALVTLVCVVLVVNSLLGVYFLFFAPKVRIPAKPPTSRVHVTPPNVIPSPMVSGSGSQQIAIPTYSSSQPRMPQAKANTGNTAWQLFRTSSHEVNSYGSGGGGVQIQPQQGGASRAPQTGLNNNVAAPVTSFIALRATQPIAVAGAGEAPQMAELASAPGRRAPGPPTTGDDPLPDDHQLVEHPLPDGMLMLLLLAGIYAVNCILMKKRVKENA